MAMDHPTALLSLPTEIHEEILVYCALYGSYPSVSAVSQTCRSLRDIFYNATDTAIWREIFLLAFDDPRTVTRIHLSPTSQIFDGYWNWRPAYQERIRMKVQMGDLYLNTSYRFLQPQNLAHHMKTLSSILPTSLPYLTDVDRIRYNQSNNIHWLKELLSLGFPKVLTERLISLPPSTSDESTDPEYVQYKADLMKPDWELSEAGQQFYHVLLWTGFLPYVHPPSTSTSASEEEDPTPSSDDELESPVEFRIPSQTDSLGNVSEGRHGHVGFRSRQYELRSVTKRLEREAQARLEAVAQRRLACIVAQHRVYNMRYLSRDRCWGPFLRLSRREKEERKDNLEKENEKKRGKGKEKASAEEVDVEVRKVDVDLEKGTEKTSQGVNGSGSDSSTSETRAALRILREILDYGVPLDEDEVTIDEDEDEDYIPPSQDVDVDMEDGSSSTSSSSEFDIRTILHPHIIGDRDEIISGSPGPIYPIQPHLLFPDYAFLSAARIVVETDLRDILTKEYSSSSALFRPHFTHLYARKSAEEFLKRIDDNSNSNSPGADGDNLNQRDGLNMLRMGSAPGFWDGKGTREGWLRLNLSTSSSKEKEKEERTEDAQESNITDDGWDWAGVEGRWTRAVTWMDYRDLLEHSLRAISPLAPHSQLNHHIDGTRRAFNMNLRVKGYSRVPPPPVPASNSSSSSSNKEDSDYLAGLSSQDRLIYTLPIIHIDGDFRSADSSAPSYLEGYSDMDSRRVTGTVRMIGGGAGTILQSGDQEWVMEGVQIGEVGSALGVVGLWTGAEHERGDPIGATWAWKSE
ncbi:hypothetical protein D9758_010374 [Tetrapyrgos nigripes]|uniref:F-box domain-containing protein n=1 Tax=Tetrapyrgos nigripes TaxID=182062 RepID=A0A8H5D058_9AGAR|nr:hypothetical protein D9758_010374 [Tetrapyrgos nigripes]